VLMVVCVGFAYVASSRFMPSPARCQRTFSRAPVAARVDDVRSGRGASLEWLEPAGWVVEVLPGLVSISVVQGALFTAMLGLVAVMAVRWTLLVVGRRRRDRRVRRLAGASAGFHPLRRALVVALGAVLV
jgi:hypothetical protein